MKYKEKIEELYEEGSEELVKLAKYSSEYVHAKLEKKPVEKIKRTLLGILDSKGNINPDVFAFELVDYLFNQRSK